MKKLFAVMMFVACVNGYAAELEFGDLNYFLNQGQHNFLLDADAIYYKENRNGTILEDRGHLFKASYLYGVTDKLSGFVAVDYALDVEVINVSDSSNADYDQVGLSSPVIGAVYRFMGQSESGYNVDVGGNFRLNVEDAEVGASSGRVSRDGNNASARNAVEVKAAVGKKWNEANEWRVSGGATYHVAGERTVKAISGDVKEELDSSVDLFLKGSYQYRPVQTFMMEVSLAAIHVGEVSYERSSTDVSEDAHLDFDFTFIAKYQITEYLIGKFNFAQSRNANFDVEDGTSDYEVKSRRENLLGLGVEFLF